MNNILELLTAVVSRLQIYFIIIALAHPEIRFKTTTLTTFSKKTAETTETWKKKYNYIVSKEEQLPL